ncbi:Tetratricopeptide TPR-1, partial [Corchorus capsularis]
TTISSATSPSAAEHPPRFENMEGKFNIPLAANAKSVRDFDEGLTRVSLGFKSVDDYYSNSDSFKSIKDVQRPLLYIQRAVQIRRKQSNSFGGNTYKEIGRVSEAIQDYIRAINIRPNMAEAHANLASA